MHQKNAEFAQFCIFLVHITLGLLQCHSSLGFWTELLNYENFRYEKNRNVEISSTTLINTHAVLLRELQKGEF